MHRLILIVLPMVMWATTSVASGQNGERARLEGVVTDAETGKPLSGAHVFVAESVTGTTSMADGRFELRIRAGQHRIVASMVGYEPASMDVLVRGGNVYTFTIELHPSLHLLDEVRVTAERPARWARRLRAFERLFIGESDFADQTVLLNPEVLDFEGGWGRLRAEAAEPLRMESRVLGYRITYVLKEFERSGELVRYDGDSFYSELSTDSDEERREWAIRRCEAFFGSFRHFMLTLLEGTTRDAGFYLERRSQLSSGSIDVAFPVTPERIVREGPEPDLRTLRFARYLDVTYAHKEEEEAFLRWHYRGGLPRPALQRSWLKLTGRETLIDLQGEPLDPYGITLYGYFAFMRIADQLPKEYRPPEGAATPSECRAAIERSEAGPEAAAMR